MHGKLELMYLWIFCYECLSKGAFSGPGADSTSRYDKYNNYVDYWYSQIVDSFLRHRLPKILHQKPLLFPLPGPTEKGAFSGPKVHRNFNHGWPVVPNHWGVLFCARRTLASIGDMRYFTVRRVPVCSMDSPKDSKIEYTGNEFGPGADSTSSYDSYEDYWVL